MLVLGVGQPIDENREGQEHLSLGLPLFTQRAGGHQTDILALVLEQRLELRPNFPDRQLVFCS